MRTTGNERSAVHVRNIETSLLRLLLGDLSCNTAINIICLKMQDRGMKTKSPAHTHFPTRPGRSPANPPGPQYGLLPCWHGPRAGKTSAHLPPTGNQPAGTRAVQQVDRKTVEDRS